MPPPVPSNIRIKGPFNSTNTLVWKRMKNQNGVYQYFFVATGVARGADVRHLTAILSNANGPILGMVTRELKFEPPTSPRGQNYHDRQGNAWSHFWGLIVTLPDNKPPDPKESYTLSIQGWNANLNHELPNDVDTHTWVHARSGLLSTQNLSILYPPAGSHPLSDDEEDWFQPYGGSDYLMSDCTINKSVSVSDVEYNNDFLIDDSNPDSAWAAIFCALGGPKNKPRKLVVTNIHDAPQITDIVV